MSPEQLSIDIKHLQASLAELARIGSLPSGGVCRLAFSPEDKAGRELVASRMHALGLSVHVDGIGNIMGVREGREAGPVVLTGSHIDTVATGGVLDGSLGVVAALEAVAALNEAGVKTRLPVGVISFANEEGARFMPDMMGSLFLRGDLTMEDLRPIAGIDGTMLGDDLDQYGMSGNANLSSFGFHSFVELHIEQGPILERENKSIGVVEGVQGIKWIEFRIEGSTAHAGTTPIELRRDAGYVAGAAVEFVRSLATEIENQRATVGSLTLSPNLVNVVAEEARFTVDLRNPDAKRLLHAEKKLLEFAEAKAAAEGVGMEHRSRADVAPVEFDPQIIALIEAKAESLGYASRRIISGAGHDAQIMADVCPTAMIFVPSRGGISHNIQEYTAARDIEAGANVLLHTLLALAQSE
jgi:N-carbamoyl-L-amino-acid hydrolase